MANRIVKLIVAAGLAGIAAALPARADTVTWSLSGIGNGDSGSGTFTETGGVVTAVTGTVTVAGLGTFTITGLDTSYGSPSNLIYLPPQITNFNTTPAFVDFSGIAFDATAGSTTAAFNIGGFAQAGPFQYVLYNSLQNPDGFNAVSAGADAVTFTAAVPEASTWAMMLVGFAALGYAAYRRRGAAAASATA